MAFAISDSSFSSRSLSEITILLGLLTNIPNNNFTKLLLYLINILLEKSLRDKQRTAYRILIVLSQALFNFMQVVLFLKNHKQTFRKIK